MTPTVQEAYARFEAASRETRRLVENSEVFKNSPETRDGAYHVLAEVQAMAYTWALSTRLNRPRIQHQQTWHYDVFSVGPNCQDHRYGILALDGRQTYRLHGRIGDQKLTLLQVHNHMFGHPDSKEIGQYNLAGLAGADGTFTVTVGAAAGDSGGVILDAHSRLNFLVFRRIFGVISGDPGELWIERVSEEDSNPDTNPAMVVERFVRAAEILEYFVREWAVGLYPRFIEKAGGKNALWYVPGEQIASDLIGSEFTSYGLGVYSVEPDEALVITWTPPESVYWSFQACDVWARSLDFSSYQTDLNDISAAIDEDGCFRGVLSAVDPGVPNWIDTRSNREGLILLRNYLAREDTGPPELRKHKLHELRDVLPEQTPTVTPEERRAALAQRRRNYRLAYGD